jgi:transcriptional regulator with PAS, ATPase and Fis domain
MHSGRPDPGDVATELELDRAARPQPGPLRQAYLVCRLDDRFHVVSLDDGGEVVVGRAPDAPIHVDSTLVSRSHARLRLQDGVLVVEDLGSRNGTRVNGDVLRGQARVLSTGGTIEVGPMEIVVARAERALDYEAPVAPDDAACPAEGIIVADAAMRKLYDVLSRVSSTSATVLILGETGVGKEIVAEQIHRQSPRSAAPFLRLNCASVPEALLESELFGHERGAFTGADRRRAGYFEAASGGTLLLDELGEMPLSVQAKLLRVLERRTITRLGATEEVPVDVRILCATHRDLAQDIEAGSFRRDLYYRIATFTVQVPPLRERPTEIVLLAELFARRFAHEMGQPRPPLGRDAVALLLAHRWPGNVRELRNAMEYAVVMAGPAPIAAEHLPASLQAEASRAARPTTGVRDQLGEVERQAIVSAIAAEAGNHTRAAKRLGISRRALLHKLVKYNLRA